MAESSGNIILRFGFTHRVAVQGLVLGVMPLDTEAM